MRANLSSLQNGIPSEIPQFPLSDGSIPLAPTKQLNLSNAEFQLAVENALRYFPIETHPELAPEFISELKELGHIYMLR